MGLNCYVYFRGLVRPHGLERSVRMSSWEVISFGGCSLGVL